MSTKFKLSLLTLLLALTATFTIAANPLQVTTFQQVLEILKAKNIEPQYKRGTFYKSLPNPCFAEIIIPRGTNLSSLTGLSWQELETAGHYASATGKEYFEVDDFFCNGGGGGGMTPQHAANYIWMLITFAILALIASMLFRGRLIPTIN